MDILKEVLERTLEKQELNYENKHLSTQILDFLYSEQKFFEMSESEITDIEVFQLLGSKLNLLREEISYKISERIEKYDRIYDNVSNFKDKLYIFGISCLPMCSDLPFNLLELLLKTRISFSWISKVNSVEDFFVRDYCGFELWNSIYQQNGIDGIARYLALNNKIEENIDENLVVLYLEEKLSKNVILNLTSTESSLSEFKSSEQAKIVKYHIDNQTCENIIDKPIEKVIEL